MVGDHPGIIPMKFGQIMVFCNSSSTACGQVGKVQFDNQVSFIFCLWKCSMYKTGSLYPLSWRTCWRCQAVSAWGPQPSGCPLPPPWGLEMPSWLLYDCRTQTTWALPTTNLVTCVYTKSFFGKKSLYLLIRLVSLVYNWAIKKDHLLAMAN